MVFAEAYPRCLVLRLGQDLDDPPELFKELAKRLVVVLGRLDVLEIQDAHLSTLTLLLLLLPSRNSCSTAERP